MTYIDQKETKIVSTIGEFLEAQSITAHEFITTVNPTVEANIVEIYNDHEVPNEDSQVDSIEDLDEETLRDYLRREYRDERFSLFREYLIEHEGAYTISRTPSGYYKIITLDVGD